MKAVRIHKYGDKDVLTMDNIPTPKPESNEILVKIKAAGVNPVDWKIREGYLKDMLHYDLPITLGWDVAGIVEEIGKDVKRFKKGDRIYSRPEISKNGSYAEYMVIAENEAGIMPRTISFVEAAGVPLAALTAWAALFDEANLRSGQKVLIHGAVGGVGSFAVQLAKEKGCEIYGTVSTKNIELAKKIGVNKVIDYTKEDFSVSVKDMDVVLDTIGGETQQNSFKCLKRGGVLVSTVGMPDPKLAEKYGVVIKALFISPNGARLEEIARMIDANKIKPLIDKVFPLEQAKEAQVMSQSGHAKGKIILKVDD